MHILIAPNAFKNSLDAGQVAAAIEEGLLQSNLDCTTECFPVGDGGDGTGALLMDKFTGEEITVTVKDPLGRNINSSYGLIDNGTTAVIEMTAASGLRLLKKEEYNPLRATSFGTGQLLRHALGKGVQQVIIAIGGSATVDGGIGILQALGVRFLDAAGYELHDLPERLTELHTIDISALLKTTAAILVICDVDNTLLGQNGAAPVFGPQKGATPKEVQLLEAALSQLRDVTLRQTGKDLSGIKHGGAAGGVAAAMHVFLGAQLVNGIDYFLEKTNFDASLQKAQLVITGEGSIDIQTLHGKAPWGVAKKAKQKKIPVIGVAGRVPAENEPLLNEFFDALLPIGHEPVDMSTAIVHTKENLIRTAKMLGNILALRKLS